jgi:cytosine/adenosine deaminase-related metal-dependent hydrolase
MAADNQNLFEAMRVAGLGGTERFPYDQARWLDGPAVWAMATTGGARALGLGDLIGAVAPGRKADLVILRRDSAFLRPLNHAVNALVFAETGADVETVLVDGRIVLEQGRVLTVDETRLRARAQDAADRIRTANAPAWALAARLQPYVAAACRAAAATPWPLDRFAGPVRGRG